MGQRGLRCGRCASRAPGTTAAGSPHCETSARYIRGAPPPASSAASLCSLSPGSRWRMERRHQPAPSRANAPSHAAGETRRTPAAPARETSAAPAARGGWRPRPAGSGCSRRTARRPRRRDSATVTSPPRDAARPVASAAREVSANGSSNISGRPRDQLQRVRGGHAQRGVLRPQVARDGAPRAPTRPTPPSPKPMVNVRTGRGDRACISATTSDESMPPERKAPSGTSAHIRSATASRDHPLRLVHRVPVAAAEGVARALAGGLAARTTRRRAPARGARTSRMESSVPGGSLRTPAQMHRRRGDVQVAQVGRQRRRDPPPRQSPGTPAAP